MTPISHPTRISDLASLLHDRVRRHYGAGSRTEGLQAGLSAFGSDQRPVDPASLAEVEAAAQTVFRHLELTHSHGLHPQEQSSGWPEPDLIAIRRAGADVAAVHRNCDGTPADHVVPLALTHDVHALIPEARVVATDGGPTWEGLGVQPDETDDTAG